MPLEDATRSWAREWMNGVRRLAKKKCPVCALDGSVRPGLGVARTLRASPEYGLAQAACLSASADLLRQAKLRECGWICSQCAQGAKDAEGGRGSAPPPFDGPPRYLYTSRPLRKRRQRLLGYRERQESL